jgi:tetratricopeptide (TPR) repeat protein/transcriptional regulator with XRE-family HTH domain
MLRTEVAFTTPESETLTASIPPSQDTAAFGARLRACRESAALSQQELAERAGLSAHAISDLERGRTRWPYPGTLRRVADGLGLRDAERVSFIAAAPRRPGRSTAAASTGDGHETGGHIVPRLLPAGVPGFTGRDAELAALSQVLDEPAGTAVITAIGGTAGVGKTALAVHWGHQVAAEFPDGQLFVNLRGFGPSGSPVPPDQVIRALLEALGTSADQLPATAEAQLGLYRSLLAVRKMLIVLDNARDEEQVRPLLPGSPTCRVVVTSRNQLTGLGAIEAARPLPLDVLTADEARRLLGQRLGPGRVAADPAVTDQIIAACGRLPLALTVIAARAAMQPAVPLAQIAEGLHAEPGLDAFSSGDPAADVRTALSWSIRQLDHATARTFRLAGLHPGPDLAPHAVAALTGGPLSLASQRVKALARASLLQPTGTGRYRMHDLVRVYAGELVAAQDGKQEARRAALTRLFDYYLHGAGAAMDALFPDDRHRRPRIPPPETPAPSLADPRVARAWLDAERASMVAVAVHAAASDWPGHATRLASTLHRYLDAGAFFQEAIAIHACALRAARNAGDRAAEAEALGNLGIVHWRQSRYPKATRHFRRALVLCREIRDQAGEARALNNLGIIGWQQGRHQQAAELYQQAAALFREAGSRVGEARALGNLGIVELRQGRYSQAADHYQQALALHRQAGNRPDEAQGLGGLGDVELRQGRYSQASDHYQQALALHREVGDRRGEAQGLTGLGDVELRQGRYSQASDHYQQALALHCQADDRAGESEVLNGLGEVCLASGQPGSAATQYAAALALASDCGERYQQGRAHDGLGRAHHDLGDRRTARRHWQQALALLAEIGSPEADQVRARLASDDLADGRPEPGPPGVNIRPVRAW